MIVWLSEVFSSNSDKARMIAILISALVAIGVLLLNQYFLSRRTRKELLITKIEELYQSAIEYESKARELLKGIDKGQRDERGNFYLNPELIDAMNDEVHKMDMLVGLHFPEVNFDRDRFYAGPTLPVLEIAIKEKRISEAEALEACENTKDNIRNNSQEIKKLCKDLMQQYRH